MKGVDCERKGTEKEKDIGGEMRGGMKREWKLEGGLIRAEVDKKRGG